MRNAAGRFCQLLCLQVLVLRVRAIPVDNGIVADPEIRCRESSVTVAFSTQNVFEGHVYVKGLYDVEGCRTDATNKPSAEITVDFAQCNAKRQRMLSPSPGMQMGTTIIITFHPNFLTKVDRAYNIRCFYQEIDKTVTADLQVSMLTTVAAEGVSEMPQCIYEVLEGGPTGAPVRYALIGDPVYHKWSCKIASGAPSAFCITVHSCFVSDGNSNRVELIDKQGCSLDRFLLQNVEYQGDLEAGREAHIFKYADKTVVYFDCQIRIVPKTQDGICTRFSDACLSQGGLRRARQVNAAEHTLAAEPTVDVSSGEITVIGGLIENGEESEAALKNLIRTAEKQSQDSSSICLTYLHYGFLIASIVITFTLLIVVITVLSRRSRHIMK